MKPINAFTGEDLKGMFAAATEWLEKSAAEIDSLNVFPVPDGDTGTNMFLTMRSTIEEAYRSPDESASRVCEALAHGALMGARGNSGVILSQIFRGLARGLKDKESVSGSDLAGALREASLAAYKGVSQPVEGTILTVIREAAAAAQEAAAKDSSDLVSIMEATVAAAKESVLKTPSLLPVLREAGVVDAGGQGLFVILEGVLRFLKGETEQMQYQRPYIVPGAMPTAISKPPRAEYELYYGYCTEFLIKGQRLNPDKIRKKLEKKGESLMVVGDESTVRVHIHTFEPGAIISYATSLGMLHGVRIRNMDEQHEEFVAAQRASVPSLGIAIVAVVSGEGLCDVFRSLGVSTIVPGGKTMNPSTKELLRAVELAPSDRVIILPNNSNIIPVARQIQSMSAKRVEIVPTETIPQGVSALLAFDREGDLETNVAAMERARATVRTVEVTTAVRSTKVAGLKVKKGQAIGFLDHELVAVGTSKVEVLHKVLLKAGLAESELVTIYYGADTQKAEAEAVAQDIRQNSPGIEVELIYGGQPNYDYIVSVE